MNSDFEELLRLFNASDVKYLIVGGHAVMLYSEPRYTKDLGIWIEASRENGAKMFRALAEFGAPLSGLTPDDFSHEGFFYQIGGRMQRQQAYVIMGTDWRGGRNRPDSGPATLISPP